MRAILFLVAGVVIANIVWATFFWDAPARENDSHKPAAIVNTATMRGQEPWMTNEHHIDGARQGARRSMLEVLGKPWASHCTAEGRKRLIDALNYYFWQRDSQSKAYAKNWGAPGARYIARVWATSDDNRIERMTRETFGRGYFALDELRPYVRAALAEIVKGERVRGKPYAG
jgi:hypothetical protein